MSIKYIYDFEEPLVEIQSQIDDLESTSIKTGLDVSLKLNDLHPGISGPNPAFILSELEGEIAAIDRPGKQPSKDKISCLS